MEKGSYLVVLITERSSVSEKILLSHLSFLSVSAKLLPLFLLWTSSFHIQNTSTLAASEKGEHLFLSHDSPREGLHIVLLGSHTHALKQTLLPTETGTVSYDPGLGYMITHFTLSPEVSWETLECRKRFSNSPLH